LGAFLPQLETQEEGERLGPARRADALDYPMPRCRDSGEASLPSYTSMAALTAEQGLVPTQLAAPGSSRDFSQSS
jgi:hypothetical protein